jgi:GTPase SAR1 family protein
VRDINLGGGFLLVYSITSRIYFEEVKTLPGVILEIKEQESFPMVLVANRSDADSESAREVSVDGNANDHTTSCHQCQYRLILQRAKI